MYKFPGIIIFNSRYLSDVEMPFYAMQSLPILKISYFLLLMISCNVDHPAANACETIRAAEPNVKFASEQKFVFDTTANVFRCRVVDSLTKAPVSEVKLQFIQGNQKIEFYTDSTGEAGVFRDNFRGLWELNIEHDQYKCLKIIDIKIGGGVWADIQMKRI